MDEIQVQDSTIEPPGEMSLTPHNNYTAIGSVTPAFPGGITPDHSLIGLAEWALGVTPWWELGLHFPMYSYTDEKLRYNGFKLRTSFVSLDAKNRTFFYGLSLEFSVNQKHWDPSPTSGETRPILGLHLWQWDLIANPIFGMEFNGLRKLDCAPAERAAYNVTDRWAVAAEQYGDYGVLNGLEPPGRAMHTLFAVVDYSGEPVNVEFGVGHGISGGADRLVLKLILSRSF